MGTRTAFCVLALCFTLPAFSQDAIPAPRRPEAPLVPGTAILLTFQLSQDTGNYQLGSCSNSGVCSPGHEIVDVYPIACAVTAQRAYCEVPWSLPKWVKAEASAARPIPFRLERKCLVFTAPGEKPWKLKFESKNPDVEALYRRAELAAMEKAKLTRELPEPGH